ncbi:MAG: hypothetical protein C4297_06415 [Gemmataceae bacterium]
MPEEKSDEAGACACLFCLCQHDAARAIGSTRSRSVAVLALYGAIVNLGDFGVLPAFLLVGRVRANQEDCCKNTK